MNPITRILAAALACAVAFNATPAAATPLAPLDPLLFAFPGAPTAPVSARAAALARADRWLGGEPGDNPALNPAQGVMVSPLLGRVSRQDLRAENRNYDEQSGAFDVAGGWIAAPAGPVALTLYATNPLLRNEEFAFTRGINAPQPAVIQGLAEQRELRAGLAASVTSGPLRYGLAVEWTRRDDVYETNETSGSPDAGSSHVDFSGDAVGFTAGARLEREAPWGGPMHVGAGLRVAPALTVDGVQDLRLARGDSTLAFSAERESGIEGGVAVSLPAGRGFQVIASVAGRTAQAWSTLGVSEGAGAEWRIAGEFVDPNEPWILRFGLGQEHQSGVPESRAGVIGLGFGWRMEGMRFDLGAMRRTLERADQPTSYDDRLVGSVLVEF